MNAIELLKKDHKTVKSLFESFEKAKEQDSETSKAELFASIKEELDAHAQVEEEIFYPAFDRAAEKQDDKELVLEAGEEHKQVKTLLAELEGLDPDDETFDAKMKVLKDNIEHHVEEEEGEMFPHAQKQLDSDRLEELGQQIAARKEQLQRQPAGRSAARSASAAPGSRARTASPRRRSGRNAGRAASGADVARASGSSESELVESMGQPRSTSGRSSGRSRSGSSSRSSRGGSASKGRSSARSSSSRSRSSSSRGGSSRGRSRSSATRGGSAASRRGRASASGRSGSSSRRGTSRRRASSSSSRSGSTRSR